jgi:hypothetical protein
MTRHLPPPHLRRLPHTVAPLQHESWGSFVNRLALANRIAHLELHSTFDVFAVSLWRVWLLAFGSCGLGGGRRVGLWMSGL